MIIGIGIDLLDVERLAQDLAKRPELGEEIFTVAEWRYVRAKRYPAPHLAARFCAKEALFKALGSGKRGRMTWQDIEILNDRQGRPSLKLHGATEKLAKKLGVEKIHVSLSHTRLTAAACVVLETDKK